MIELLGLLTGPRAILQAAYSTQPSLLASSEPSYQYQGENDLLMSILEKLNQLVSFDQSNTTGAIDVKVDGSVVEEK